MPPTIPPTKDRILDAAEGLFAQHGFDGASLREVTRAADANLAAVHYHFGSKAGLFEAVFHRRLGTVNAERLALLERLESPRKRPGVAEILHAFLAPVFRLAAADGPEAPTVARLLARAHSSAEVHAPSVREVLQPVEQRFGTALARALPHVAERELRRRLRFVLGSMCGVLGELEAAGEASEEREDPLGQLVAFAAAGVAAEALPPGA
ncbi:MAG: TetR/AcrR family transcriptional regulator [Planctomycetota bacterium]